MKSQELEALNTSCSKALGSFFEIRNTHKDMYLVFLSKDAKKHHYLIYYNGKNFKLTKYNKKETFESIYLNRSLVATIKYLVLLIFNLKLSEEINKNFQNIYDERYITTHFHKK